VLDLGGLDLLLLVVMTAEADSLGRLPAGQVVFVGGTVGAVAVETGVGHRVVGVLLGLGFLQLVVVAGEADVVSLRHQHLREVGAVGIVAGGAAPLRDRRVDELAADDVGLVVAEKTEILAGGLELVLVGGLVGVVAAGAFPVLDRRMNMLSGVLAVVALVTEAAHVLDRLELVIAGLLVTVGTVAYCSRTVHVFFLAHRGVAFGGDA